MMDYGQLIPGKMEVVEVASAASGGGANVVATLGPTNDREVWLFMGGVGFHDDGVNRVLTLSISDGATTKAFYDNGGTAIASSVYLNLLNALGIYAGPIRLHYGSFLSATCVNADAGHKAYIRGLVYKIRGLESWAND